MLQNLKANLIKFGKKMTTNPLYFHHLYFSTKKVDEANILREDALSTNLTLS
jgi:hypothetical protein